MPAAILDLDLPPDHPIRQILDVIEAHPEVREPVLRVLLTEDFLALPGQVQGLSERVDGLTGQVTELREEFDEFREETREQLAAVNERIDETNRTMQERFDAVDARFDAVDARFDAVYERIDESAASVIRRVEGSIGRLRGETYESKCAESIDTILVDYFRHAVKADRETVISRLVQARHDQLITREEYLDARSVDIIARESPTADMEDHLAVVEVSITFNRDDLETAARRAEIISRVFGLRTDAFVATNGPWPDDVKEIAQQLGVTIVQHFLPDFVADQI